MNAKWLDAARAKAEAVLEDEASADTWMQTPNRALGRNTPISLLETKNGFAKVMDLLTQIDSGTYS